MAAIERAVDTADVHDVACALIRLAADPTVKTPGMLTQTGPWWVKADGTKPARRGDHTMRCPDHGEPYLSCSQCKSIEPTPPPEDVRAEITQALEAAKTTHHQSAAAKAAREARRAE